MEKMILKDNTEIKLQAGGSLSAVAVKFDSKDDMLQAWKRDRQCRMRRSATWGKLPANWQRKKV